MAGKTVAQLTSATSIATGDLVPIWPVGSGGPLKQVAFSVFQSQLATYLGATYAQVANNLSDLSNVSTARANLGLGTAAVANIGFAAGTVAAGNDSRITGAAQLGAVTLQTFAGPVSVSGALGVTGALTGTTASFSGNGSFGGTLGVTGLTTGAQFVSTAPGSNGNFAATNGTTGVWLRNDGTSFNLLKSASSNTAYDTSRPLIVNLSTGNVLIDSTGSGGTNIGGALGVTGATTLTGGATINSGLTVNTGTTNVGALAAAATTVSTLGASSNVTIGGTLGVTGLTTGAQFVSTAPGSNGNFAATNGTTGAWLRNDGTNVYLLKNASSNTTYDTNRPLVVNLSTGGVFLDQTGAGGTSVGGTLGVTGNATAAGLIATTNGANITGSTVLNNGLTVTSGGASITGSGSFSGSLSVTGGATFSSSVSAASLAGTALASAAQTLTGSSTTQAITPAGFAGSSSIAANGYYKLPGGLVIAWGSVSTAGAGTVTVTFPYTFTNVWNVQGTEVGTGGGTASGPAIYNVSTTGCQFTFNPGASVQSVYYVVIGN